MSEFESRTQRMQKIVWHLDKEYPRHFLAGSPSWRECINNHAKHLGENNNLIKEATEHLDFIDKYMWENYEQLR